MIVGVANGTGTAGFAIALALASVYAATKLLNVVGWSQVQLPLMLKGHSRTTEVAALVAYCGFALFFLVALMISVTV